jgi:hypothetical protein
MTTVGAQVVSLHFGGSMVVHVQLCELGTVPGTVRPLLAGLVNDLLSVS